MGKKPGMKNVYYLGITSLFADISTEMIAPIIPIFLSSIGASGLIIGIIEGLAKASEHVLSFISGYISDKIKNRKNLAALGYLLSGIMKGFFAIANNWFDFLFFRALERSGKAIRNPPRDALIAESLESKERRKGFAVHRILDTIGAIVGPILTILIFYFFATSVDVKFYRNLFFVSAFFGVISFLVIFLCVREGKIKAKVSKLDFSLRAKWFLLYSFIFYFGFPLMAFFYLRVSSFSFYDVLFGAFFFNFFYIIGALFCGRLKIESKKIIFISTLLISFSVFSFAVFSGLYLLFFFALLGVLFGIYEVEIRNYIAKIEKEKIGSLFGLHRTTTGFAIFASGIVFGFLWDTFKELTFILFSAIIFISSLVLHRAFKI